MNTYKVFYIKGREEKIYKVKALNEKDACNKFMRASGNRYKITDVVNETSRTIDKVKAVLACICIVILFILVLFALQKAWSTPDPVNYVEYTVEEGDTLWSIASNSDMWNKMNAHDIIDDIIDKSDCSYKIYPGQIVYIPMYKG